MELIKVSIALCILFCLTGADIQLQGGDEEAISTLVDICHNVRRNGTKPHLLKHRPAKRITALQRFAVRCELIVSVTIVTYRY